MGAKANSAELRVELGPELADALLDADQSGEQGVFAQRQRSC